MTHPINTFFFFFKIQTAMDLFPLFFCHNSTTVDEAANWWYLAALKCSSTIFEPCDWFCSVSEIWRSQLVQGVSGVTGPDPALVKHLSEGELAWIPRALASTPALRQKPWKRGLKERKRTLSRSLCVGEHNQAQPSNHETQVKRDLQFPPCFSPGPCCWLFQKQQMEIVNVNI